MTETTSKAEEKLKDRILSVLHEHQGDYFSGEALADRFLVSRQAVWKAVRLLTEEGIPIQAVTRRGYRLDPGYDLLLSSDVYRQLPEEARAFYRIEAEKVVTSTNTLLKARGIRGEKEGLVLLAEEQSEGRGRMGRSFYSPKGTGLYMSLLLRPPYPAEESILITTLAAVCAAEAVEALIKKYPDAEASGENIEIKWVNDLYLNKLKIAGILTEATLGMESGQMEQAVLGIGFNLAPPEGGFPEELRDIAGAVFQEHCPPGARAFLAAQFLTRFLPAYQNLAEKAYLPEYRRRQFLLGKQVEVLERNESVGTAEVLGVDEDCRLLVRMTESGEKRALSSGEVRVRKL